MAKSLRAAPVISIWRPSGACGVLYQAPHPPSKNHISYKLWSIRATAQECLSSHGEKSEAHNLSSVSKHGTRRRQIVTRRVAANSVPSACIGIIKGSSIVA